MERDFLFEIGRIHHLVGKMMMQSDNRNDRPTPSQIRFIEYLANNQNRDVYQSDLEKEFKISRATVHDVLDTMEKKGMITREKSKVDTRRNRVILNKNVLYHHEEVKNKLKMINTELIKNIDSNDLIVFCKVLDKMNNNMHNMVKGSDLHDKNV